MTRSTFFCLATVLLFGVSTAMAAAATATDPLTLIDAEYRAGKLSLDDKVLLEVRAIRTPDQLPPEYKSANLATSRFNGRGACLVLNRIVTDDWEQLSGLTQTTFKDAMTRWSTNFEYDSPGGFFKLHYDITGTHAVSSLDADSSGVPDYVEKIAAYFDSSLAESRALGYTDPPPDNGLGGDNKYDIYFEEMSYYGYTVREGDGPLPSDDRYSHIVMHRDFIGFPPNTDPEGNQWGAAKVTAAHELHHAVQFSYDAYEGVWFMELDATYIEDITYDHVNDNYNYLDDFFNVPNKSLMENSGHAYASFIWGLYLAQVFDTSLMVAAWQGATTQDIYDAMTDSMMARYGVSQDDAFADFAVWNFMTSTRDDGLHHEEAAEYPLILIGRTHTSYPVNGMASPNIPNGYSACYVQFYPGINEGQLTVNFNGLDAVKWRAFLVLSTSLDEHTVMPIALDSGKWEGSGVVDYFDNYYCVTLIGVNVSAFTGSSLFTYSASIREPYALSSIVVTDSSLYSGASRTLSYRVYNTSPLFDVVDVTCSDDMGWVVIDTVDKFILGLDSADVQFQINVPDGVPLGTHSTLTFSAQSRSDTLVTATQEIIGSTVLQRGDVNFEGALDLSDLIYLVNYLFQGGPEPLPMLEAGNVNCSGGTDLSDLIYFVNFLFQGGPNVPCNPF
ncbi:hypothetical protein KQH51_01860 [bacterium]|nr:hypothetical protein [bacterium]MCB2201671.1 hypothetical protein [bacterium]